MGTLYNKDKAKYSPIEREEARAPVLLTQLRKDAIRHVLKEYGGMDAADDAEDRLDTLVEEAFTIWVKARYESIPNHFAESVITCLQDISSLKSSDNKRVVVGAITDGNSDPTDIPELSEYFDFCVNAETVGVSKPDKSVYLRGVARALEHPSLRDILSLEMSKITSNGERRLTDAALEDLVGPWWVHVGDDFVKDCVAAKNLNMRTIWARELVLDNMVKEEAWRTAARSSKQGRTVEELVKEVAELEVIEMQVGADNYLADSLEAEFADAVTDQFRDIATIVRRWQVEAAAVAVDSAVAINNTSQESKLQDNIELIPGRTDAETMVEPETKAPTSVISSDTKFCIHCGTKIPVISKFCFSCGEKQ
jgi:FMN phosphatase YigB (HAD superfamily)